MSPLRAVSVEILQFADEGRTGKRGDIVGEHPIALDLELSGFAAGIYRNTETAFGLAPEGFGRKPFLDPDAE